MTLRLVESSRATADANGRAQAEIQPLRAFEKWSISKISVASDSTPQVPTCNIYRGFVDATSLVEGTYTGTLDSTDLSITLENGEKLIAVWEGASVNANCTLTVQGERNGR